MSIIATCGAFNASKKVSHEMFDLLWAHLKNDLINLQTFKPGEVSKSIDCNILNMILVQVKIS